MKKYIKPQITDVMIKPKGIVPLAAISAAAAAAAEVVGVGVALASGYAIGRAVKSMKVRVDDIGIDYLERVITNE